LATIIIQLTIRSINKPYINQYFLIIKSKIMKLLKTFCVLKFFAIKNIFMKKINLVISLLFAATLFSCEKRQDEFIKPAETTSLQSNDASTDSGRDLITSRATSALVETFGPFGSLTGASFGIFPPSSGSVITGIGIGNGDGSFVNALFVRYKDASGNMVWRQAGVGNAVTHEFQPDEYITGISGRSSSFLNSLIITTNKASYGTLNGTAGTPFSAKTLVGDWILSSWGRFDNTRITQISFGVYPKPWQLLAGSGGRDIAVALDGTAYLTNVNGVIYKMEPLKTSWQQLSGSGGVRIAANANRVCLINVNGSIYELFGSTWRQMPGSGGKDITINSDGKIWLVNSNGTIYRYNDNLSKWEVMPGSGGVRIAAGSNMVWLINSNGTIYRFNNSLNKWDVMPGSGGRDIAVGNDGSVWLTNVNGVIYNFNSSRSMWNELSGSAGSAIAANNKKAQLVNTSGNIYKLAY
jgi:virginiamycin B lyase